MEIIGPDGQVLETVTDAVQPPPAGNGEEEPLYVPFSKQRQAEVKSDGATEEKLDHLAWCGDRREDLETGPSILVPLRYARSLGLGAGAALISDKVSPGFVHATGDNV